MVIKSERLTTHSGIAMQKRKRTRKRGSGLRCATTIEKNLAPRYGPLPGLEHTNIISAASVMTSSKAGLGDDCAFVIEADIEPHLIDNAVEGVGADSPSESIYTEMAWTPACDILLRFFREHVHPEVRPPSTDNRACSDALIGHPPTPYSQLRQAAGRDGVDIQNDCPYQSQCSRWSRSENRSSHRLSYHYPPYNGRVATVGRGPFLANTPEGGMEEGVRGLC